MPTLSPGPAITHILLDLDGTLYPKDNGIWNAISARMERYMADVLRLPATEIPAMRQNYFLKYGTTLRGLQHDFALDAEAYLAFVHDIDLSVHLKPDSPLRAMLQSLPQPKYIFTNADSNHSARVLAALGIADLIAGTFDVWAMGYNNKPHPDVYRQALDFIGAPAPAACVFVDDTIQNLAPARDIGIRTVLVAPGPASSAVDHTITTIHELAALPIFG